MQNRISFFIISLILLSQVSLFGQHEENHSALKNHFALFAGNTHSLNSKSDHLTFGADYVRMVKSWLGVGVFGEAILADHTEWIIGAEIYVPLYKGLSLRTGPGIEFVTHEVHAEEPHDSHSSEEASSPVLETNSDLLFRVGLLYAFHVGPISIIPSIDYDLVNDRDFIVYGLNIGASF